jgi:hypothetical protein
MLKGVFCLDMLVAREEFKLMYIGLLLYDQLGIEVKVANVCLCNFYRKFMCVSSFSKLIYSKCDCNLV